MRIKKSVLFGVFAWMGVLGLPVWAQHEGDVWVGVNGNGQLAIGGFDPSVNYVSLPETSGILNGWADNDPGFDHLLEPDESTGIDPLEAGALIDLQVVALDAAFRVIDNAFQILDAPGEDTFLGDEDLHTHLTWHINSDDPLFDPAQCVWEASFVLVDTGTTGYGASEVFTYYFTHVPTREPDGDFDQNGVVDLSDFHAFDECMAGPGTRTTPDDPEITTCEVDCANAFDFDLDLDVDWIDFGQFQTRFAP